MLPQRRPREDARASSLLTHTTGKDHAFDPTSRRLAFWYFCYFAFVGAFAPYFALYLAELGQSAWQIAVLMTTPQVMRLVAPTFWGWLGERHRRPTRLVIGSAFSTLAAFALFFFVREHGALLAAMALTWFFWSAALPLVESLTLAHLAGSPDRYGHIRLWGSIGFIFSVAGLGFLLDALPIRTLLWSCLALLASVAIAALMLPEAKVGAGGMAHEREPGLWRAEVVALLAASFFMAVAHGPLYIFYSLHLAAHGYEKSTIGFLWSLGVIAEIVVFLFMPRIAERISPRVILLSCFALAVLRFLLIGWYADSVLILLIAQLMHAATFGAHHAAVVAVLARWFPGPRQARMQGLYGSLSFGAGGLVGGLISGQAWDTIGAAATYSLGSLAAAIGGLLIWRWLANETMTAKSS